MARQKKIKTISSEQKEVSMSDVAVLEGLEQEIDLKRQELEKIKLDIEEKKAETKGIAIREDEEEVVLVRKTPAVSSAKAALKEKIEKQKAFDDVVVTGKFINRRYPGNSVKLLYMKYEDCVPKWYEFQDGGIYSIPRGFVEQIKEHYYRPRFNQKTPEIIDIRDMRNPGSSIQDVDTSNKLYDFVPVSF